MYIYKFIDNLYIMETEKYYGLNEPDKTTTIDSSNIDYNIPGQTTENPSLNATNTSILYKASATSNYKKQGNCPQTFILDDHNDAITDSSLYVIKYQSWAEDGLKTFYTYYLNANGEKIYIYLGYEDTNKIFTNKLSSIITTQVTTLDSDTDGCSAKAYLIPNDNTGAPIKFSLNKCTADRIITFSYKNTPIFKINQTYTAENMYYTIYLWEINTPGGLGTFAFFKYDDNNPVEYSKNSNLYKKTKFYTNDISNTNQTALFCYSDDPILLNSTVSELMSRGFVEHVQGHDYLISNQNKYNQLYIKQVTDVNVFSGGTIATDVTTTKATLGMTISIYQERTNGMYQTSDRIRFGNVDNTSHVGIYKIKK